ncbi:MAG: sulfotransferase domain-containing protein [Nanoarchaeota archaeon]|nr:sulfotransferase domain-containing protein [Nanoarchaeota archaeon]
MEFYCENGLTNEILLVDGPIRAAKRMFHPIMTGFSGVEVVRIDSIFERLALLSYYNKIERDAAITLLRNQLQLHIFYVTLGRNTNFNVHDYSGIFYNVGTWKNIKRIFRKDADLLKAIEKEKPLIQVQTHDTLAHINILFDAFGDGLKVIESLRNPIDLVNSMYLKDYGKREGVDPMKIMMTIKHKGEILPWYSIGWEEKYISSSQIDRVIGIVDTSFRGNVRAYEQLGNKQKKQIFFIPFEDIMINFEQYIPRIEKFLGRKVNPSFNKIRKKIKLLTKEELYEDRKKKLEMIKGIASREYFELLLKMSEDYDETVSRLINIQN